MCGIIGIFNNENANILIEKGLQKMKNRGKDGFGIATEKELLYSKKIPEAGKTNNIFGHVLHSIVSNVEQPFEIKGKEEKNNVRFIANCEIYNWKELAEKYSADARNDAEFLFRLIESNFDAKNSNASLFEFLEEIDGDYSFAFWKENKVYVARDVIGVKPIWYSHSDSFAFASEKKALLGMGFSNPIELNPRQILVYDIEKNKVEFSQRKFFEIYPETKDTEELIEKKLFGFVTNAVAKRIPEKKLGLLFSGGVDSTLIAMILKKLNVDFTCYTAAVEDGEMKSEDIEYAKKAKEQLGLKLKIAKIKLNDVEKYLKKVIPLIEDTNVIKVGVALPFYLACEAARKDNVKVILSGLGSEELFAGYERHLHANKINSECLSGLQKIYERDTYRDDVVTMDNSIELRVPFLDKALIEYSLKIPGKFKIKDNMGKYILRKTAEKYGMPKEFSWRKKRAAQYGSRFDKAIEKLAKRTGEKRKSDYLKKFYEQANLKLGVLFSGGKDSTYAMQVMKNQNYEISCLISLKSKNQDSFMFHTPNIEMTRLQSECLGIPIIIHETLGEKEKELIDLKNAIKSAVEKFKIQGIVTGALFSDYQRERIEKIADDLGIKIFSPLWHMPQDEEMYYLAENFEIVLSSVAALGLNKTWLGRRIEKNDIQKLIELNKEYGINVAGEGGEFESLVLDAPMFVKKIIIEQYEIIEENENTARMIVKKARLSPK